MSLLQQLRNKRRPRGVLFLENVVNRNRKIRYDKQKQIEVAKDKVERDRLFHIEQVREEEKKEKDNIKQVKENREEVMKQNIIEDNEKDTVRKNTTLNELITGFLTTKENVKYIKVNAVAFKALNQTEQQTLYNLYLRYL